MLLKSTNFAQNQTNVLKIKYMRSKSNECGSRRLKSYECCLMPICSLVLFSDIKILIVLIVLTSVLFILQLKEKQKTF